MDIDVVRRLRPTAGDVLVIKTSIAASGVPRLAEEIEQFIPEGVRYAIVRHDVDVELADQMKVRAVQAAALRDFADDLEESLTAGDRGATIPAVAQRARERADALEAQLAAVDG